MKQPITSGHAQRLNGALLRRPAVAGRLGPAGAPLLLAVLLLLIAAGLVAWATYACIERYLGVLVPDRMVVIDDFPQISGIAYWPEHGTLIGVGDNGEVAELDLNGKVLRKRIQTGRGFEDIAMLPEPGLALVIDGQSNRLVTLRLADLRIDSERAVPNGFAPTWRRDERFEGMALAGNPPRLILGNAFPPAVTPLDVASGTVRRSVLLGARSISAVLSGPSGEMLVVSRESGLLMLDADGHTVWERWRPVAYRHLEGAALVPGVGLVLCAGRDPGVLLVFSAIRDWQDLRHVFAH